MDKKELGPSFIAEYIMQNFYYALGRQFALGIVLSHKNEEPGYNPKENRKVINCYVWKKKAAHAQKLAVH